MEKLGVRVSVVLRVWRERNDMCVLLTRLLRLMGVRLPPPLSPFEIVHLPFMRPLLLFPFLPPSLRRTTFILHALLTGFILVHAKTKISLSPFTLCHNGTCQSKINQGAPFLSLLSDKTSPKRIPGYPYPTSKPKNVYRGIEHHDKIKI